MARDLRPSPASAALTGLVVLAAGALRRLDGRRRTAENALSALNVDLEDRVQQRTAELVESEGRVAASIEWAPDAVVEVDVGRRIIGWNRQAALTFGWTRDEIVGRLLTETLFPERLHGTHEQAMGQFPATGELPISTRRTEVSALRRDGTELPVALMVSMTGEGSSRRFSAFLRDLSHYWAREGQLRASEELFRTLADSAPVGIFRTDAGGAVIYVNGAWCAMTGVTSEEAMGSGWRRVFHPDDRDEVLAAWGQAAATGTDFARRFRFQTDDGRPMWVDARAVAFQGGDAADAGLVGGFIGTVTDVSSQVEAEASIVLARDQAVEASRTKSDFLATMSHEIRTPMNGVIGLTGLLLETQLTETQRHYAEGVRASGEALLGIINDILDFSKIEAGKLELETVDFDVAHAVEAVAALVAESARAKGLELVAYCRPEVPTALRGDVGRLRQILLNFATNAVKFTEAGEVVLRADLIGEPTTEQVMVRFEVSDTGVGVDPATAGRLFEPFSQADASTTRRYGGTGLGLAICRRLADAMGGTVGVDSTPGPGSTFWLQLAACARLRAGRATRSVTAPAVGPPGARGRRQPDQPPRGGLATAGLEHHRRRGRQRRGGAGVPAARRAARPSPTTWPSSTWLCRGWTAWSWPPSSAPIPSWRRCACCC